MRTWLAIFLALAPATVDALQVSLSGWGWKESGLPLADGRVWLASGGDTARIDPDGSWKLVFETGAMGGVSPDWQSAKLVGDRLDMVGSSDGRLDWRILDVRGRTVSSGSWTGANGDDSIRGDRIRRGWINIRAKTGKSVVSLAPSSPSMVRIGGWFENLAFDSLVVEGAAGTRTSVPLGGWQRSGISVVQAAGWNPRVRYGLLVDPRDGHRYQTVLLGGTRWMAENLAFAADSESWFQSIDSSTVYGLAYSWRSASAACPPGWRLPSKSDWEVLGGVLKSAGQKPTEFGASLKSASRWLNRGGGADLFGFRLLPSGFRSTDGTWHDQLETASLWLSDTLERDSATLVSVEWSRRDLSILKDRRSMGYAVRCVSP